MAELVAVLDALPPSANRYTFMAQYLATSFAPPTPPWYPVTLWVFFVMFCVAFLFTAAGLLAKSIYGNFHLFQIKSGLIIPNGVVLYSIFQGFFILCFIVNLQWAIQNDNEGRPPTGRLALFGILWFFFWTGGFAFTMSTISYTLKVGPMLSTTQQHADYANHSRSGKTRRRALVYLVDFTAIFLPIAHIFTTWPIFILANQYFTNAVHLMDGMKAACEAKALSYNADTFSVANDLFPLLADMEPMAHEMVKFKKFSGYGYTLLATFCLLSLVIWLPFAINLRLHLLKLMDPTILSRGSSGRDSNVVANSAAERYNHLMWTTACIFLKDLAYGGVALSVAIRPTFIIEEDWNLLASTMGAGIYAFVGTYIAGIIAWRSIKALRVRSTHQTSSTSRPPLGGTYNSSNSGGPIPLHLRGPMTSASATSCAEKPFALSGDGEKSSYTKQEMLGVTVEREVKVQVSMGAPSEAQKMRWSHPHY